MGALMFDVCVVLSGRGLCDELITRPEESYRLWRVVCVIKKPRERGSHSSRWGAVPEKIITRRDCTAKYQIMDIQAFWDVSTVTIYQSTRRNIQKESNLKQSRCEKLESSINDP
jgi:hypothetical protein